MTSLILIQGGGFILWRGESTDTPTSTKGLICMFQTSYELLGVNALGFCWMGEPILSSCGVPGFICTGR